MEKYPYCNLQVMLSVTPDRAREETGKKFFRGRRASICSATQKGPFRGAPLKTEPDLRVDELELLNWKVTHFEL